VNIAYYLQSAQLFLDSCDAFRDFFSAVATLDALAGFAAATHPGAAPPGCAFCRPTFATSVPVGEAASQHQQKAVAAAAPPLRLQGVWSPALLASGVDSIQPNDLELGGGGPGGRPGMLLLTGANTGGKSTLLRSACLAVIMAQASPGCWAGAGLLACIDLS
jgi:DNA mismatch repair protein MSH6